MPRRQLAFLLVCFSGVALLAPPARAQEQALVVLPDASPCLAFRTKPASDATQKDCLAPGTKVSGIGTAPYWRRIRLADNRTGWAAKKFLGADVAAGGGGGVTPPPTGNTGNTLPDDAWLEIHFVDVGSGDGIWIHTHDDGIPGNGKFEGKNIVIDGGPVGGDHNAFLDYLEKNAHADAVIDALFLSHPHDDHYSGAGSVIQHFDVCDYYENGFDPHSSKYDKYKLIVAAGHCRGGKMPVHSGRASFGTLDFGSELTAEVLYAYPGTDEGLGEKGTLINSGSIVLRITYGTQSFLFMGDLEGKDKHESADKLRFGEKKLLDDPVAKAKLRSTLIKAGHHGSETSSTSALIDAVDPQIVIISSGRRDFNTSPNGESFLPDITTIQRWCAHNPAIRVYRTDQDDEAEGKSVANDKDGDNIVIETNGKVMKVEAMSGGEPFVATACAA